MPRRRRALMVRDDCIALNCMRTPFHDKNSQSIPNTYTYSLRTTRTGNSCYNGSLCIPLELDEGYVTPQEGRTTRCDCTTTTTDGVAFFAGYGCEYSSSESCLFGESNKGGSSFCVNGGKCKQKWSPNEGEETM